MSLVKIFAAAAVPATLFAGIALADTAPPVGSMKLSEVVAAVENQAGAELAYIKEVDWDDNGYWEIEYRTTAGARVELRLDPVTGESR
ncbi:MAG: PepSY domain-containing protein [Paracoccus sp. (in: a-proteobacteria)]|uniref:PepSY domain-containing protein n=1 Tax=Paracoccus sp. TaxID=267 RepID=UPI0026E10C23|nr:PepSY domain-containing protein [Paracoccus sp. (in: a-proteobacteria)]MDO5632823.1 PepSY domain-containing protein [Paracoccus sp. (in: a-proteobacteria)]